MGERIETVEEARKALRDALVREKVYQLARVVTYLFESLEKRGLLMGDAGEKR